MADMKQDTRLTPAWVNAHTAAGHAAGIALVLQNKGPYGALLYIGETAPAANTSPGFRLVENQPWGTDIGDTVWVRSEGDYSEVSIQEG